MNNPYQEYQIFDLIKETLVQVLGCNANDVTPDAALVNDLNADSLDFIEFRHILEKRLEITLPQKSVLDHLSNALGSSQHVYENGRITPLAATVLHQSFFHYDAQHVHAGMLPYEIMQVTTIRNWTACCYSLFNYLPDVCPHCQAIETTQSPLGKVICSHCCATIKPQTGDTILINELPRILTRCPVETP